MRAVAVVALLTLVLSGCSSSGSLSPEDRFPDAEQRWADRLEVAADVEYEATILDQPAVWRVSADAPDGFDVEVYGRRGLMEGDLDYEEWPMSVQELSWRPFTPGYVGPATVQVECAGPCAYAVARDDNGTLAPLPALGLRYRDADAHFAGTVEGEDFASHDFEVPEGVTTLRIRASAYSPDDWFRFAVTDPDGDTFDLLRFPAVRMDGLDVTNPPDEDGDPLPAGTWNLLVTCDDGCEYAFGFSW